MLNFGKQILTRKLTNYSLITILGLSGWLIFIHYDYFKPVRVIRLQSLNISSLPDPWPNIFSSPHAMPLWMYVKIQNKDIQYFAHVPIKNIHRSNVVIASIKEILESNEYHIVDGIYLFNLGDITRYDYPWPILAFTARQGEVEKGRVVLIPDNRALKGHDARFARLDAVMEKYPWEKRKNIIFWRGKATGGKIKNTEITQVPRLKFMQIAQSLKYVDAGITEYPKSLNQKLRTQAEQMFAKVNFMPLEKALDYKYLMDIDGHSCSFDRMAWILYSNSVLFKHQSDQVQWYYENLLPWVHYVPINAGFTNIAGTYKWIENHPEIAREISANSRRLAEETFNHAAVLQALADGMNKYQTLLQTYNQSK